MKKTLILGLVAAFCLAFIVASISVRKTEAVGSVQGRSQNVVRQEPYQQDFEVQVLMNGWPLEKYSGHGKTYIQAVQGAEYEIRIRNPLPYRVAVALSVDGLNSIDARRTTAWSASKWVLGPYETIQLAGWQMSSSRARHFYFTSERDSYGAKLGQTSNLGVITAVFFREREPRAITMTQPSRPDYEEDRARDKKSQAPAPSADTQGAASSARREAIQPKPDDEYAATGIGRSVQNDVRWISLDLDSRPAAEVSIRYEYYPALVRLGILPRPPVRPDPLQRREGSSGFEGRYSPEP